ncbi:hypothetical protein CJA_1594 [Cellvibrio japonicus Ueda107]|uniref:Uncharacterized protein n=1 Tax=Cellvibrio japonicus (strain Ueda107) TaxID=498211 RepID=B3PE84_CELJU|nr:hypothetical protein CJA_1594 [Cellvibrio japonicus Ueda107]
MPLDRLSRLAKSLLLNAKLWDASKPVAKRVKENRLSMFNAPVDHVAGTSR